MNPLMPLYFTVTVRGLVERHLYLPQLEGTHTIRQVATIIGTFRDALDARRAPRVYPH